MWFRDWKNWGIFVRQGTMHEAGKPCRRISLHVAFMNSSPLVNVFEFGFCAKNSKRNLKSDLRFLRYDIHVTNVILRMKFPLMPMGSSLPGLHTRDHPLGPPSTWAEICWRTCLQSHIQTSPSTLDKEFTNLLMPGRVGQGLFCTIKGTCVKCQLTTHTLHFDQKK